MWRARGAAPVALACLDRATECSIPAVRLFDSLRPAARAAALVATLLAVAAATPGAPGRAPRLPAIVFVSRQPLPGGGSAIPGLGPHHRAAVTRGRLMVREPDGRLRELLPPGAILDVSDPSVSRDGRRIAFAAVTHPDSAWRIWVVGVDGSGLRPVTFTDRALDLAPLGSAAARFARYDDLDPCWIHDSVLVFASTRYPQRAQYDDVPVTNLFAMPVASPARVRQMRERGWPGGGAPPFGTPVRITSERNGAEEPVMDWARGRIVFARWWFNRFRAAASPGGLADAEGDALPADSVNLWQPMELTRVFHRERLAAGDLRTRRSSMGYQPTVLADGDIAAVYAANLGLSPQPGGTGVHAFAGRFGHARRLAGAIVAGRGGDVYSGAGGLAPSSACAPSGLPDGRLLISYSPGARGDFGVYVVDRLGSKITRVVDLPGTLELDAAPIVRRPEAPGEEMPTGDELEVEKDRNSSYLPDLGNDDRRPGLPPLTADSLDAGRGTFRFHDLDVFRDGPVGSPTRGAARRTEGARIRFFATLARPGHAGGDTVVLVREAPVGPGGEVSERGLPADVPMFEQLVGSDGRVLMTAHGPAHVAGSNAGLAGYTSRCVGCHRGHSTLPVPLARARTRGRP